MRRGRPGSGREDASGDAQRGQPAQRAVRCRVGGCLGNGAAQNVSVAARTSETTGFVCMCGMALPLPMLSSSSRSSTVLPTVSRAVASAEGIASCTSSRTAASIERLASGTLTRSGVRRSGSNSRWSRGSCKTSPFCTFRVARPRARHCTTSGWTDSPRVTGRRPRSKRSDNGAGCVTLRRDQTTDQPARSHTGRGP